MKLTLSTVFFITILTFFTAGISFSQQDTTTHELIRLYLLDGSEVIGNIVDEDSISINFKTVSSIAMAIPKMQVKSREFLQGNVTAGEYIRTDPNDTRLFFAPTARSLKPGKGYFSTYEIFFPFIAVGVSKYITLAGGMSIFPGAEGQLYYFAPKVTPIQKENFSAAGGLLYLNATSSNSSGVGFYYAVGTYGTQKAALTFGLGWGFYGSEIANKPIVMLGGELRVSNSIKFISENWIPPNSDVALLSFGIRFFGDNLAADLGFIHPSGSEMDGFPFIPWVGFAYNFGSSR